MRAVLIREVGPPAAHRVESLPDPLPGPGEVLIDVEAASVNFPDLLVIEGRYQLIPPTPFVPGKEAAGMVIAVGHGVQTICAGQRVLAQLEHGAFATRIVAPAAWVTPIPERMSYVDAAAMGLVYQTAYFALMDRGLYRQGETVLVTGAAGGVGLAAVQLAKAMGARVIAGVSSSERVALVRANGADAVIDLSLTGLRENLRKQVHAVNDGRGVDIVLDVVGGDVFDGALRSLAWCGRIVVIGFAVGRIPEIKANYLLLKNISAVGLQWSDYRERAPERMQEVNQELFELYEAGKIRPHVASTLPLDRFADAMELLRHRRVLGKVVLTMT